MLANRSGTALADAYQDQPNLERVRALADRRGVTAASMEPGVSVAVLNLDRPDLIVPLARAAEQIAADLAAHGLGFELLIADTGSTHPDVLALYGNPPPCVSVVTGITYQFSRSNNDLCDGRVRFDHLLLLNNDVLIRDSAAILEMLGCLGRNAGTGIVGLVLDYPDGTLQHAGVDVVRHGPLVGLPQHPGARTRRAHRPGESWEAIAVTGAALMIRTELWLRLRGLDQDFTKECQDVDLCLRAQRLGYRTRVVDAGPVVHEENGTRPKREVHWPDRRLFLRRWMAYLEATDV